MSKTLQGQKGIDARRVSAWLEENIADVQGPFTFRLIVGGRSNLTFEVRDANGRKMVLRRPPLGEILPSAHDMRREHKIISALEPTAVPVPKTLGLCADPDVNGGAFYVMAFAEGAILRDLPEVEAASRLEAAVPFGDSESLDRLRERTEDAELRPAGGSTLLDANVPRPRERKPAGPAAEDRGPES